LNIDLDDHALRHEGSSHLAREVCIQVPGKFARNRKLNGPRFLSVCPTLGGGSPRPKVVRVLNPQGAARRRKDDRLKVPMTLGFVRIVEGTTIGISHPATALVGGAAHC
jgi:hypothetical protein